MNTQFKKGVLELIVLQSISHKDLYGYQLVTKISEVVDVNEGTIYPLLKKTVERSSTRVISKRINGRTSS